MDTLSRDEIMDSICLKFIQMKVPQFGDSDEYKVEFTKRIEDNKFEFSKFIKLKA